jgi:nucleotide-binding universal stress UspA family protein
MRILVAVHGSERPGWTQDAAPLLPLSAGNAVRVLVVLDVPTPGFTSLAPWGRRAYGAALRACRRQEEDKTRGPLTSLLASLGSDVEVVRVQARPCGVGQTIAEQALAWPADLVVTGMHATGRLERALLGTVHEIVVRRAPCPVLVVAPGSARDESTRAVSSTPAATLALHRS